LHSRPVGKALDAGLLSYASISALGPKHDQCATQQPGIKGFANGPATQPMKQQPA